MNVYERRKKKRGSFKLPCERKKKGKEGGRTVSICTLPSSLDSALPKVRDSLFHFHLRALLIPEIIVIWIALRNSYCSFFSRCAERQKIENVANPIAFLAGQNSAVRDCGLPDTICGARAQAHIGPVWIPLVLMTDRRKCILQTHVECSSRAG